MVQKPCVRCPKYKYRVLAGKTKEGQIRYRAAKTELSRSEKIFQRQGLTVALFFAIN